MTGKTSRGLGYWIRRALFFAFFAFLLFQLQYVLRVAWFGYFNPVSTPYIRSEAVRLSESGKPICYEWADYRNISPWVAKAVIAAEDANFMEHSGVDWSAVFTAFTRNVIDGKRSPGGSTLTQQTVKNLILSHDRSYLRKIEEIFLSSLTECLWSKKRILEVYLNIAEFGNGIFGIQAASRHYFRKSAKNLTRRQAEWLAAILASPKQYESRKMTPFLHQRLERIRNDLFFVRTPR